MKWCTVVSYEMPEVNVVVFWINCAFKCKLWFVICCSMLTGGLYKNHQRTQQKHGLHQTVTSSMTTYSAHECCQCVQPQKKFDEKEFNDMENKFEIAMDHYLQDNLFFKDSVRFASLSLIIKIMSSDFLWYWKTSSVNTEYGDDDWIFWKIGLLRLDWNVSKCGIGFVEWLF